MQHNFDIIISGAGLAGLVTAVAFGSAGFDVLCVDPALPVTDALWRGAQTVTGTQDRDGLWRAQTPQGFHLDAIRASQAVRALDRGIRDLVKCRQRCAPALRRR